MKRGVKIALVIIAVGSFAAALSYPLLYRREEQSNNKELEELAQMRADVLEQLEENGVGAVSIVGISKVESAHPAFDVYLDAKQGTILPYQDKLGHRHQRSLSSCYH